MPKHMRWPKSCDECGCRGACDGEPRADEAGIWLGCPLVVWDAFSLVDWKANGWPEPTPFYGSVDTSNIPQPFNDEWYEYSYVCEEQFENVDID